MAENKSSFWNKYNKRLLIISLLCFILISAFIVIFGIVLLPDYNDNVDNSNKITSVYDDSKIDFVIPSPSKEQIEDMKKMEHIEDVFPLYSVYTTFSLNEMDLNTYVLLLNSTSDLENTMFKESRAIEKREKLTDNSLLIDEVYAKQHNLSLGDEVEWKISPTESVTLVVDGIYYENVLDDVQTIVFNTGKQKEIIDRLTKDNPIKISSAYINSKDNNKTNEMLKAYKPLGMKKTASDFSIYSDYENYLLEFEKTDHYKQIIKIDDYIKSKSNLVEEYDKSANKVIIKYVLIVSLISLLVPLVINLIGKVKSTALAQIEDGTSFSRVNVATLLCYFCVALLTAICGIVTSLIGAKGENNVYIYVSLAAFVGVILNMILQMVLISKASRVQNQ